MAPAGVLSPLRRYRLLLTAARLTVLVTGAAGVIGCDLCERSPDAGDRIIGLDCLCDSHQASCTLATLSSSRSTGARRRMKSKV